MNEVTEAELASLLRELFEIDSQLSGDTDLTTYINDSIDLGELLAALYERYNIRINPNSFRNVFTLDQALAVINADEK